MRIHVFDPQLGSAQGRSLNAATAMAGALERRGLLGSMYGAAIPEVLPDFAVEPVFRRGIFEEVGQDAHTWALENFFILNEEVREDLGRIDPARFERDDVVFFPNILQNQLDGARAWLLTLPPDRRPTLAVKPGILTHLMPSVQGRPNAGLAPLTLRLAVWRLTVDHPRSALCTDTPELAQHLQRITGAPFIVLPSPLGDAAPPPPDRRPGPICCAFLGRASMLKGFHLLPAVVGGARGMAPSLRFVVQSCGEDPSRPGVEQALERMPGADIRLERDFLSPAAYRALLDEADIVVLPYSRDCYGWAASGVVVEAMARGKVVVAPEGTTLAREAAALGAGCQLFRGQTPEAILGALNAAVTQFDALASRARASAPAVTARHSSDAFVEALLAAAAQAAAREPATA